MTKEFLRAYYGRVQEAKQIRARLERLYAESASPRSPSLSGMPSAGGEHRAVEEAALQLAEMADIYEKTLANLTRDGIAIEKAIAGLEARERMLMRARYIDGLKWRQVCEVINYEWNATHKMHREILRKLQE